MIWQEAAEVNDVKGSKHGAAAPSCRGITITAPFVSAGCIFLAAFLG
jgi:hypothetical protein